MADFIPVTGAAADGITDDTAAIQSAIDYAVSVGVQDVVLPSGPYRTTDTLHIGYGTTYTTVRLIGSGRTYGGNTGSFPGTTIKPDFSDRPAINIQGARGSGVADLAIVGLNQAHLISKFSGNGSWKSDAAQWVDPTLAVTADTRYTPYAGISVDWFSGAPSNKNASSRIYLKNVEVSGFVVGVVVQPSGHDGNGDFLAMEDCVVEFNKYGLSIGNSQSRNVNATNCRFGPAYRALTNTVHGAQHGQFGGVFTGCNFDRVYDILNVDTAWSGTMTFNGGYGEGVDRIGSIGSGATDAKPVSFTGFACNFTTENDGNVEVEQLVGGGSVAFKSCRLFPSRVFAYNADASFEDCTLFNNSVGYVGVVNMAAALSANASRQLFPRAVVADRFRPRVSTKSRVAANVDTGGCSSTESYMDLQNWEPNQSFGAALPSRTFPLSAWAHHRHYGEDIQQGLGYVLSRTATPLALTSAGGLVYTTTAAIRPPGSLGEMWIGRGDLVLDSSTGARMFVSDIVGSTISFTLLSGYRRTAGVHVPIVDPTVDTGTLSFFPSRIYTHPRAFFGTAARVSATVTDFGRYDGTMGGSTIAAGDYLLSGTNLDTYGPRPTFNAPIKVVSINTGDRSMLMSGNAQQTAVLMPLNFWLRAP